MLTVEKILRTFPFSRSATDKWMSPTEDAMDDNRHIYKIVELAGSSPDSIDDAIRAAISRAGRSLRNLRWFEVLQTRGHVENGEVSHFQVVIKAGFTLEDEDEDDD